MDAASRAAAWQRRPSNGIHRNRAAASKSHVASHTSHTRQARKWQPRCNCKKSTGRCRSVRDYGWPRVATIGHGSDWALARGTCVWLAQLCMCVLVHVCQSTLTRAQLQHSVVVCSTVMPCHLRANASSFNTQGLHSAIKPARLRRHPLQHALAQATPCTAAVLFGIVGFWKIPKSQSWTSQSVSQCILGIRLSCIFTR
jgi:hypothetical protein